MKPGQYDIDTAKEMVGDYRTRLIEEDARKSAGIKNTPTEGIIRQSVSTYSDCIMKEMEQRIWETAYSKRIARLDRIRTTEYIEKLEVEVNLLKQINVIQSVSGKLK